MSTTKSQLKKIDLQDPTTFVQCAICNKVLQRLPMHCKAIHNITGAEYLHKYGGVLIAPAAELARAKKLKQTLAKPEVKARMRKLHTDNTYKYSTTERKELFGSGGETHPLYGTHQSNISKRKNSISNKLAYPKVITRLKTEGTYEEYTASRVNKGKANGMYGITPPKGSGRCSYHSYISKKSGNHFWLQGSYELRFAQVLDNLNCDWEKTKDRFKYFYKGSARTYNPDFKVIRHGEVWYYETKGYIDAIALVKFKAIREHTPNFVIVTKKILENYERHVRV